MYDELVERDPKMKKMRAESEARGEVKGVAKGLRKAVLRAVKLRFPALIDQAQQKVVRMSKPTLAHDLLVKLIYKVTT
jgi:hypothetical protein